MTWSQINFVLNFVEILLLLTMVGMQLRRDRHARDFMDKLPFRSNHKPPELAEREPVD